MSDYDPFARGPLPVGVRNFAWTDAARDRTLPVEVWYPATEAHRGQDLDAATQDRFTTIPGFPEAVQQAVRDAAVEAGARPAVLFSHGFGGDRRQSTFYCTHLASHGYVVASMDHVGNTTADMLAGTSNAEDTAVVDRFCRERPDDCSFVLDRLLAGDAGVEVAPGPVGITGHSFGGWTSLMTPGKDARFGAIVALAPAGGHAPGGEAGDMAERLDLAWGRDVPTLLLVAEGDLILPLDGMRDLHARIASPHDTLVLGDADHFHFCDDVEQTHDGFRMMMAAMPGSEAIVAAMKSSADLCPGTHAYDFNRGPGLAHFDAHLRGSEDAGAWLAQDLPAVFAERAIAVTTL